MDFALTEEQHILRHSVERLFADHYAFEARRRYSQEPRGWKFLAYGSAMPSLACSGCRSTKNTAAPAAGRLKP